ncbi:MAG: ABC transporter ATP-binding protein [Candidatus Kariarchaeaceae archaeon]|jgi:putative ABC transport system ATP-binding protein
MNKELIILEGLSKIYDDYTPALNNINLSIENGEWTSIIGPSGSGKTTLLNMISCLDKPTNGSIMINGIKVSDLDRTELTRFRRENIGLIFQQHYLIPYLTALENVMLAMYYNSAVDEEIAIQTLKRVGLGHRLHSIPSKLSGGEQQRVCIARSLINNPKILIADEPTGNLDQKNGNLVLNLIKDLHKEGNTIFLVTHNLEIAKKGNRILEIIDGEISMNNQRTIN